MSQTRVLSDGGGAATSFNSVYQWKQLSYGQFDSFEYVAVDVRSFCWSILVEIYMSSELSAHFHDDSAKLL